VINPEENKQILSELKEKLNDIGGSL